MAHLFDCLLIRPSVKDEGLAFHFDDVWDEGVIGVPRCVIVLPSTKSARGRWGERTPAAVPIVLLEYRTVLVIMVGTYTRS